MITKACAGIGSLSSAARALALLFAVCSALSCTPPGGPATGPAPTGDTTAPSVSIESATGDPTGASVIDVKIIFSEAVTGFDVSDLTIANASAGNFIAVDAATYTVDLTPSGPEVTVSLDIAAGVCKDSAGNPNAALGSAFCRLCTQRPTVVISSSITGAYTNVSPIPLTITFNKAVESFISTDVVLANCTIANFATTDNVAWTAELTPAGQGLVSAHVPADVCCLVGLPTMTNTASSTFSITFGNSPLGVTLTSVEPEPTNTSIQITVTFSSAIDPATFTASDISVSGGGVAGNLQTSDNKVFTADVTPGAQGVVTITVAEGVCQDLVGNSNAAAPGPITRTYDNVKPSVVLSSTVPARTNVNPTQVTVTFSEAVTGFTASDISVSGGTAGNVTTSDNIVFTADVTATPQSFVTVKVLAGVCQDAAGNTNSATGASVTWTYDTVAPNVTTFGCGAPDPTNISPIPMLFWFSEQPLTGFGAEDIVVSGGSVGSVQKLTDHYAVSVVPSGQGLVTVTVPAGGYQDAAGNFNVASTTFTRTYDTTTIYPGNLDADFLATGAGASSYVYGIAAQSDGKIVIGGAFTTYNGTSRPYVARLNADGTLDSGFATGTTPNGGLHAVAVQPDGKIVIVGWFTAPRVRVMRLLADGSPDSGFAGGGANDEVHAIALQGDGRILIGGNFTSYISASRTRVARINTDGTADATFTTGTGANAVVRSVAVQADGRIIIGGDFTMYNGAAVGHVARLNSDGTLDTDFTAASGTGAGGAVYSVAMQGDKILIGGSFTGYNGTTVGNVARLNSDGTLDGSFASSTGASSAVRSIVVQGDGKLVIGGDFGSYNGTNRGYVARLNPDGTLDTGFLASGSGANYLVYVAATQADGKILIGGYLSTYHGTNRGYLARLWN
jgi:uncharacterized delta-60 repeat protein